MSEDISRLLAAQAAIRTGDKEGARQRLQDEISANPQNVRAWLWLAGLAETAQQSMAYVQEAARLSPGDPGVHKAQAWAQQRLAASQTQRPAMQEQETATQAAAEGNEGRRLDALREQQREHGQRQPARRRRWLLIAPLLLLLLTAAITLPIWRAPALALVSASAPAAESEQALSQALKPTATRPAAPATAQPLAAVDTQAVSFVSGYFAPKALPAAAQQEPAPAAAQTEAATPIPLEAKRIERSENEPRPTWTVTPSPTFTPTALPSPVPTFISQEQVAGGASRPAGVGANERWIDVNLTTQMLVAYEGDRAVYSSRVSSGTWRHPTVTGQFRVWLRYTAQTMDGRRLGYDYYLPNVPYVMYFYRDYALHGTYWHNNFGTPMSHGCVNLPTPAAEWIFNWSSIGTLVSVHY